MKTQIFNTAKVHQLALDAALRDTVGSTFLGVSLAGEQVAILLTDAATDADQQAALVAVTTHDPVFLSVDKPYIDADGTDTATITIQTIRPDTVPVVLLVNNTPVTPTNGVVLLTADDPVKFTISVQNPYNRTNDTLTVEAL